MDVGAEASPPKKRGKTHFTMEDKTSIMNTYKVASHEVLNDNSIGGLVQFTAAASGVHPKSVYNVLREHRENHGVFNPPKPYARAKKVLDNITDEHKNIIRRIVHSFFQRNEPPTIPKILQAIEAHEEVPTLKKTTLGKVLKAINFRFKRRCRNSVLKEKNEIITWRRQYLRTIRDYKEQNRKIYYLDETWINAGHTVTKVWTDMTVTSARTAFVEGLTTGLKHPSGKGKRFIILHIGSKDGFLENGLLLFESKKTGDYHEDMNAEVFEAWLAEKLPTLEENAVIVLDNASYHSRKVEKMPSNAMRKADIQLWLQNKNITFANDMVKGELLTLVKQHPTEQRYAVDELIKQTNRSVLRLPPYHCELNPIELIWAQVKGEVARKNTTFKLSDVKILFNAALQNVSADNWKNAIKHVNGIEVNMWQLDIVMEAHVEPLIINLQSDDSSSSSDTD